MKSLIMMIQILLCTCVAMHAQENSDLKGTSCIPVRSVKEDSLAFKAGEKMDFVLHYKWGAINTDVGYASVSLDTLRYNGEKVFLCSAYGKTTRMFDLFFKVREDFKSWFRCDGLTPVKFTRDTYEGGYEAKNTYIYDWSAAEPYIAADVYSSKRGMKSMQLPLTPCTFDLPALFFFARNMNFDIIEPGRKYPMTFAIDDEVFNVYFILHGRETVKVKGIGTVRTIKFAAKLLEGEVFKGEEDMIIWVTDDENRLPVLFEAPLLVGVATGRMTGYEGLAHPFDALVETKKR
ncbi:MAG: DUF3108 domain-containing protein [Bacteroidales bacterium]|nr:DUF3108 domain-containing protein [Bacteroidales bacterium]